MLLSAPVLVTGLVYIAFSGKPDEYVSESVIYTGLVSGFNIESGDESRLDYHVVNSGFDNLITTIQSRETLVAVSSHLLSEVVCGTVNYPLLEENPEFAEIVDEMRSWGLTDCDAAALVLADSIDAGSGLVYDVLFVDEGPFSLQSLTSNLSVKRINSSDLLKLRFKASDPDFAYNFLTVLNDSFIERYQRIKRREVGTVVEYFTEETSRSHERLLDAVERLQTFGTENRVINYYEQSGAIASQKEYIDEQIQQETIRIEAAESAVQILEERIGASDEIQRRGQELVDLRQQYAQLTTDHVISQSTASSTGDVTPEANGLLTALEMQIQSSVADLYDSRYSTEGLGKTGLLERWLEEMVALAQSRASLAVLQQRRLDYAKVYEDFAPLGSTLSSLEREVDVAEGEYLELLSSLNQARVRQQNIEMSSSMDVLDQPSFPHEPAGSNLPILMLAACFVTFVMGVGTVTAVELLDESLRSPADAQRRTGMDVLGFIPEHDPSNIAEDADLLRSVNVLAARVKTIMASDPDKDTHLICIASTGEGDGKSTAAQLLARQLGGSGLPVMWVSPSRSKVTTDQSSGSGRRETYEIAPEYSRATHIKDLMQFPAGDQVVIIMELPAFGENEIPVSLLKTADTLLWVARAHSVWTELQESTLRFARELAGVKPMLVLNAVKRERLESAMGEMSKDRSFFRKSAKRMLQRNFS